MREDGKMQPAHKSALEDFESLMLVSKQSGRYKRIDGRRAVSGKFYTQKASWLTAPVREFIENHTKKNKYVLDPFAGGGDLLNSLSQRYKIICEGYDLPGGKWPVNDSLVHIPNPHAALICANPPYLAKHSAQRKGVFEKVRRHYVKYYDLYETAIARCMEAAEAAVFIIPETFLHSGFPKNQLKAVSVITDNPFNSTENPVCAACFESSERDGANNAKIYIGDQYICAMSALRRNRKSGGRNKTIVFNDPSGNIALKAVDGVNPHDRIRFEKSEGFYYGRERVKSSSRLLTYISIKDIDGNNIERLLKTLNQNLEKARAETADLLLSPFKGNNKAGKRRRRLDYSLARQLIEQSLNRQIEFHYAAGSK